MSKETNIQANVKVETQAIKNVTTISELKKNSAPTLVAISDFYGEGEIYMELKPASVMELAAKGTLPNELLGAVTSLFNKGLGSEVELKKKYEAMREIARSVMASPTLEDLEKEDIKLTDKQLTEIYIFAMNGVKSLKAFRQVN